MVVFVLCFAPRMPTVLDLCGIETKTKLDGHSVMPLIRSPEARSGHEVLHWAWGDDWAVRQGDWKLIGKDDKPLELVSLAGEEPERENHLEGQPELADRLLGFSRVAVNDSLVAAYHTGTMIDTVLLSDLPLVDLTGTVSWCLPTRRFFVPMI